MYMHPTSTPAGAYSTFVISKSGDVVAWGLNNSCQLGIDKGDEQNNLVWVPSKVCMGAGGAACVWMCVCVLCVCVCVCVCVCGGMFAALTMSCTWCC